MGKIDNYKNFFISLTFSELKCLQDMVKIIIENGSDKLGGMIPEKFQCILDFRDILNREYKIAEKIQENQMEALYKHFEGRVKSEGWNRVNNYIISISIMMKFPQELIYYFYSCYKYYDELKFWPPKIYTASESEAILHKIKDEIVRNVVSNSF